MVTRLVYTSGTTNGWHVRKLLEKFVKNGRGNFAVSFALLTVPMLGAAGAATDYAMMSRQQTALQDTADATALAVMKELGVSNLSDAEIQSLAENYVRSNLMLEDPENKADVTTSVTADGSSVAVGIAYTWEPLIIQYVYEAALPIRVKATAAKAGREAVCVIALDNSAHDTLALTGKSSITADGCAVYSNSSSPRGMSAITGSTVSGSSIYSGGGFDGASGAFTPTPVVDSPELADPLGDRHNPAIGGCIETNLDISSGSVSLNPGTYCGGMTIEGNAEVTFKAGDYVIKDGPFVISGDATVKGNNVGFFFSGNAAVMDFGVSTQVDLGGRKTGPMTGMLFFEDRNAPLNRDFVIRSKDAERFEGTVYLPRGRLVVDKASRIGQRSKWTAIIANQIDIRQGPEIKINSDYSGSDIPVPQGIASTGARLIY